MRQAFSRTFDRAYHEMHGSRPADDFDATPKPSAIYMDRRNGSLTLRELWRVKTPLERFIWIWGLGVWALFCAFAGIVITLAGGIVVLVFSA